MPRRLFSAFVLVCLFSTLPLAAAQPAPWGLTLEGTYERTFRSAGFSARQDQGFSGLVLLEYRALDWLSIGAGGHGLYYQNYTRTTNKRVATFTGLDLALRLTPVRTKFMEPYLLLMPGYDIRTSDEVTPKREDPGFVGTADLGVMFPLTSFLALDFGAGYSIRPGDTPMHSGRGRLGLQLRFGGPAPEPESAEVQSVSLQGSTQAMTETAMVATPEPTPEPTAEVMAEITPQPTAVPATTYVDSDGVVRPIKKGETLWRIAREQYGDPRLYPLLMKANPDKIPHRDLIRAKDQIKVPASVSEAETEAAIQQYKADDAAAGNPKAKKAKPKK